MDINFNRVIIAAQSPTIGWRPADPLCPGPARGRPAGEVLPDLRAAGGGGGQDQGHPGGHGPPDTGTSHGAPDTGTSQMACTSSNTHHS